MVKHCIAVITKGVLSFVSIFVDNDGCIWSYFQMTDFKLHIDYSKIYPSLISRVLSLEKIY